MDKQGPHRYSTGNHIQYPAINYNEKEYIYISIYLDIDTHTHTHTYIFQALAPELLAQSEK